MLVSTVHWWHTDVSVNSALYLSPPRLVAYIPNKKVQCADSEILKTWIQNLHDKLMISVTQNFSAYKFNTSY